jgi:hypothetical protein
MLILRPNRDAGQARADMKDFLRVWAAPIVIIVLGIVVALMFMAPAPPKRVITFECTAKSPVMKSA